VKRRDALVVLGSSLVLAGCWGETYSYRQKLTVLVSTPSGEKSGSAITEVTANVGSQGILSSANVSYRVRGEAAVVDLGNGKYLIALLSSGGEKTATEYWAMRAFYKRVMEEYPSGSEERMNKFYTALLDMRDSQRVAPDQYPLLVTFRDITDPKSVIEVKPDTLADVFGAGFALRAITLEITDEGVTQGSVETLINWLSKYPEPPLCDPKSLEDFSFCATSVHHGDFIRR
jgi:hypothetical protein